jgi:sugar O-acyltransferase (sialic acid O-acetyltransferase NeuD family)
MGSESRNRSLLVVGAGGFGRETIELVRALQSAGDPIELLGVYDDDPALDGHDVMGVPVLGPISAVHDHPDALVVVTIGNPTNYRVRKRIVAELGLAPDRYATLIHPTAIIPGSTQLGRGSVIHAHCVLTADVTVGSHVVMMPSVVLTHDDRIDDFATLGAGAKLAGGVTVAEGAYIGSGALLREYITVGGWSLVGMGAVVTHDIPPGEVWVGSPARRIRAAESSPS